MSGIGTAAMKLFMKLCYAYLGVSILTLHLQPALAATVYVDRNSTNATAPYTNWATAATTIQDAIDAATAGDQVLVTNGVYQTGERIVSGATNRVAVTKMLSVQSANGPGVTIISGSGVVRCVYLTNGATFKGFTLSNGVAINGGAIWCGSSAVVSNCVLTGNSASSSGGGSWGGTILNCALIGNSAGTGGGAYNSLLNACIISSNTAASQGGGALGGTLNHCVLVGNSAQNGGGCYGSSSPTNCTIVGNSALISGGGVNGDGAGAMNNCIVFYNNAPTGSNHSLIKMNYCCTAPVFNGDTTSFTNAPRLVDPAGGNLRLQADSPCINAGKNSYTSGFADLDSNPRIAGGTVDMGAYEFPAPTSVISYAWLQQNNLPIDGSADYADADGDGSNNWQEWRAGTIFTNASSALRILTPLIGVSGVTVRWQSLIGRSYWVERATNRTGPWVFTMVATNLSGVTGTRTYVDTTALGTGPFYYRVGVQP